MSDTVKRVTLSVVVNVAIEVDVDLVGGDAHVISVVRVVGVPTAGEIMEALDYHGEMQQLDDAYTEAGGEIA